MAAGRWIFKTEPSDYSFPDLVREGRTAWTGVRSPAAQLHLRAVHQGDEVLIYHTGDERALVGLARVAKAPFPDPTQPGSRAVAVELVPVRALAQPVPLSTIKADTAFKDLGLVRIGRLSVMPVTDAQWGKLLKLGA